MSTFRFVMVASIILSFFHPIFWLAVILALGYRHFGLKYLPELMKHMQELNVQEERSNAEREGARERYERLHRENPGASIKEIMSLK